MRNDRLDRRPNEREMMTEEERRLTLSEEELAVGKREIAAGEVEIEKDVETRHVRETVPVRHEEVIVERRPVSGMSATDARIGAQEIRIPVTEEEVVASKRVIPKEEIVARKREVVENETIEADLRRERAEVHEEGDVRRTDRGMR